MRGRTTTTTAAIAIAVCLLSDGAGSAERQLRPDAIVDLALTLDAAAIASLEADGEKDVRGTLAVAGSNRQRKPLDVEVRIKGQKGSKRSFDHKPALRIGLLNGSRILGFEHLTLNNMVQDQTMLHEAAGYQVYADAGVIVPETTYVRLTVNEQPYGLYLLVETIDRGFLSRRFGNATGILYEGAYGTDLRTGDEEKFELDEGKDPGRKQLARLIRAVEAPGDGVFYGTDALIDTRSFLSMMAVAVLVADWDNYYSANNYRIYWNPATSRWFFIPTGIDQTFVKEEVSIFGGRGVLFRKCLGSRRCSGEYLATVGRVADRFERLNLTERMDALVAVIDEAAKADPKRRYSSAAMDNARKKMRRFIAHRPDRIRFLLQRATGQT
jgi:spore coat protein CotH